MQIENLKKRLINTVISNLAVIFALLGVLYLLISLYFNGHYFIHTKINGVNVSLKAYDNTDEIMRNYVKNYLLIVIEKDGKTEEIAGSQIGLHYSEKNQIPEIRKKQKSIKWVFSLFQNQTYTLDKLFYYSNNKLKNRIAKLNCLGRETVKSHNVSFCYSDGLYKAVKEIYGNQIKRDILIKEAGKCILKGEKILDLKEHLCYDDPVYTLDSPKTNNTLKLLNRYVSAKITYVFGEEKEILDGNIIRRWLSVDDNLKADINKTAAAQYIKNLGIKYDTVGITRQFKTSAGKVIEVKGGLYGWKMDQDTELKDLLSEIRRGARLEKEPVYTQKALYRGKDEIGNTYVEINITRQHLWYYKEGKLITQGPVVTGNPNKGNSTVVGTYTLNYKQKDATLSGPGYEVKVNYWMPFYGNIGLHDAGWRYSFGGEIYKRNGTHGCVNAPLYLARTVFENLDEDTPIISYEE